jgi:hypothetical protein
MGQRVPLHAGISFAYYVLTPAALKFFIGYSNEVGLCYGDLGSSPPSVSFSYQLNAVDPHSLKAPGIETSIENINNRLVFQPQM